MYGDPETLTPAVEQAEVLRVVHDGVIKEECELAGGCPPGTDDL